MKGIMPDIKEWRAKRYKLFNEKNEHFKEHPKYEWLRGYADSAIYANEGAGYVAITGADFIKRIEEMPLSYIEDWLDGKNELERKESYSSENENKEWLWAEWIPQESAYRIYRPNAPQKTIAYDDASIEEINDKVIGQGYAGIVENKEPQKIMLALNQMPADTKISPFGSSQSKLVYIPNDNIAYLDEDLSFLEEDEEYDYDYEDEQSRGR